MEDIKRIKTALKSLRAHGFEVKFAESKEDAMKIMLDMIPRDAVVGVGDSATIRQVGILGKLASRGAKIVHPFSKELRGLEATKRFGSDALRAKQTDVMREALRSDVFLTSSNTVTLDGKLVNIDAAGNRVVGMIFGPERVIIVVGRNKIVKDVDEALRRLRNVIVPYHSKVKEIKTPCVVTGKCNDCGSPQRLCHITTIIERKPGRINATVIIVNEDLGLGWDESWPVERINKIKSDYEQATWPVYYLSHEI